MILRNPIYTPTIIFKPIKDMQQHTACLPILRQILVHHQGEMSRLRDTEQEVQCSSNRKLTEPLSQSKLSQPETIPYCCTIFGILPQDTNP